MTPVEFSTMCREICGSYGWKTKAALMLGISRKTVQFYASGISRAGNLATIKRETVIKLTKLHEELLKNG